MDDLYAEIHQSSCDKLLKSVDYPFMVFRLDQEFPGCDRAAARMEGAFYKYTEQEVKEMLAEAVDHVTKKRGSDVTVNDQIFAYAGSIIEQAKKVYDIASSMPEGKGPDQYEGPKTKDLKAVVDGGIVGLPDTLKPFGDWGLYAWCPHLDVVVKQRPSIDLASPRIDLNGIKISVTATGELWFKHRGGTAITGASNGRR